ncbi:hypothetical protein MRA01_29880 [Methylobacterium radiotolerans]|nr:hypothetical protein MRA01_29880 [Methylobacterium radiotolerans]
MPLGLCRAESRIKEPRTHTLSVEPWAHSHAFPGDRHDLPRRRTGAVAARGRREIGGDRRRRVPRLDGPGADGWRLSTRAPVLGIAALAYHLARRHADDRRFGIGRFGDLAPSPAPC